MKMHVAGGLIFAVLFIGGVILALAVKLVVGMVFMTLAVVLKVAMMALVITLLVMGFWKLRKMFSKHG